MDRHRRPRGRSRRHSWLSQMEGRKREKAHHSWRGEGKQEPVPTGPSFQWCARSGGRAGQREVRGAWRRSQLPAAAEERIPSLKQMPATRRPARGDGGPARLSTTTSDLPPSLFSPWISGSRIQDQMITTTATFLPSIFFLSRLLWFTINRNLFVLFTSPFFDFLFFFIVC